MKMLGDIIKSYREEHGLSLRAFAEKCGFSHAYVNKLEKGIDPKSKKEVIPTIDTLEKIADAMNISLGELLKEMNYIHFPSFEPSPDYISYDPKTSKLILTDVKRVNIKNNPVNSEEMGQINFDKTLKLTKDLIQTLVDNEIICKGKPIDDNTMEIIISAVIEDAKNSGNLK